jgi:hypothetical protein
MIEKVNDITANFDIHVGWLLGGFAISSQTTEEYWC